MIAGPWSTTLLADFGADVIKVEMPGRGDALRMLPPHKDGVGLWWKVTNRNKRGVSIDLHQTAGQDLVRKLVSNVDVLVENFRPGTLDGWGLSRADLLALNPKLIILRVTAFGQTGPYRNRPGFARVAEALSGFTNLCGDADRPPVHLGFPIADSTAGLFGALAIMMALYARDRRPDQRGEEIDLSLFESMFRLLDFLPIEFDQLGKVRSRSGNASQYAAPGNVYRTSDGKWASIAASSQSIFERLARAIGRPDLIVDERFRRNPDRVANATDLDLIFAEWIAARTLSDVDLVFQEAEVGFSPIYSIEQIFEDPHFQAREAIVYVDDPDLGRVAMQNVVPKFSEMPGAVRSTAPSLGEHNREIFRDELRLSDETIATLERAKTI
ncbi:MAG: CoA transferase [Vulcanimicrobiaceae bacterium]